MTLVKCSAPPVGVAKLFQNPRFVNWLAEGVKIAPGKFSGLSAHLGRDAAIKAPLFEQDTEDELLGYGEPVEWMADVRQAAEDSILELADHLP